MRPKKLKTNVSLNYKQSKEITVFVLSLSSTLSAGWAKFKCAYNKIKKLQSCTIWQSDICKKKVEKKIYKEEKAQINQEKQTKQRRVLWLNVITVDIIDYWRLWPFLPLHVLIVRVPFCFLRTKTQQRKINVLHRYSSMEFCFPPNVSWDMVIIE